MRTKTLLASLLFSVLCSVASGQSKTNPEHDLRANKKGLDPVVIGHGVGLFKIGRLLAQDNFENLENWVVQVQERKGYGPARVEARNHSLDCFLPGRGCTVWFKKKLKTRVTITYDVLCPSHAPAKKGLQPRDINNFWMATDPEDREKGLFDSTKFTGAFKTYDQMHGYYASTGGGGNRTTRMRRYPRAVQEKNGLDWMFVEKNGGHTIYRDELPKVAKFFADHPRNLYRKKVNLRVGGTMKFTKTWDVKGWPQHKVLSDKRPLRWNIRHWIEVEPRTDTKEPQTVDAENVGDNELKIKTTNVRQLTVYLHPKMVDMMKPVRIVVNDEVKFNDSVRPDLALMLELVREFDDRGRIFWAKVELKLDGK